MKAFLDRGDAPLLMAHRGGSLEAPEATMNAFERAVTVARADVLELDVHLTTDGVVVVHHDDDVDRTTDGSGPITAMSLEAVRALDAGYHFAPEDDPEARPWRGKGLVVPTLDEVLGRFPEVRVNIDIKDESQPLLEATLEVLRRHDALERICLATEHLEVGRWIADAVPDVCRGFPAAAVLELMMALATGEAPPVAYDVLQLPVSWEGMTLLNAENIARFHALGVPVHAWTIDEAEEMRALTAIGIDGIITDRPTLMRDVIVA